MRNQSKLKIVIIALGIVFALLSSNNYNNLNEQDEIAENRDEANLKTANANINITTPENIIYSEPMTGYYPSTYGFEDTPDGSLPDDWSFSGSDSGDKAEVISSKTDYWGNIHKKVLHCHDEQWSFGLNVINLFPASEVIYGTYEFWILHEGEDIDFGIRLGVDSYAVHLLIEGSPPELKYYDGATKTSIGMVFNPYQWYRISIDFNAYDVTLPGYPYYYKGLDSYYYRFRIYDSDGRTLLYTSPDALYQSYITYYHKDFFYSGGPASSTDTYFDAIGCSWDSNYDIGDNRFRGLLLNYTSQYELNWSAYSLDGKENVTISGNKTFPVPNNGLHTIQVFGNDSLGTKYKSDIRYFSIDFSLNVDIISPIPNTLLGETAPSFNVNIAGFNLDKRWYILDNGIIRSINITFTGSTGTIDQSIWESFGNGTVTIFFYANNSLNTINKSEVTVRKDIISPTLVINNPKPNDIFGKIAPNFNVEIIDPNIEKRWYTIDNGIHNKTFEGTTGIINQTLWDAFGNGTVTVRFYALDKVGNINSSEVTVRKDVLIPIIDIFSPALGGEFEDPPFYTISIDEPNLDSTWYTLDEGITNTTFTSRTGFINKNLWLTTPNGQITIRFYANDSVGNIGFSDVIIIKITPNACLYVEIVEQSFSAEEFNITFLVYNEKSQGISFAAIQMWWNGDDVSDDVINLGNGLYFISLDPITVAPGENPILLNMIISADGYQDKYFETYIAVDPDTLDKEGERPAEEFPLATIIIAISSIAGGIGVAGVSIVLLRRRKRASEVM